MYVMFMGSLGREKGKHGFQDIVNCIMLGDPWQDKEIGNVDAMSYKTMLCLVIHGNTNTQKTISCVILCNPCKKEESSSKMCCDNSTHPKNVAQGGLKVVDQVVLL